MAVINPKIIIKKKKKYINYYARMVKCVDEESKNDPQMQMDDL
jgi:hypothetical protein